MNIYQLLEREYNYLKNNDPLIIGESGLIAEDLNRLSKTICSCGKRHVSRRNIETGEKKVLEHLACAKSKLCQKCADTEYMNRMQCVSKWYVENIDLVDSAYMVTFTQKKKPNESAKESARRILASWRYFQRLGQKGRSKEYVKVLGGFRSLEIEPTEDGFHAHIHAILFTSEPLDFAVYKPEVKRKIRKECGWISKEDFIKEVEKRDGYIHGSPDSSISLEWQKCGEGCKSVDVEPIFDRRTKPESVFSGIGKDQKLAKKIRYSLKYAMKDNDYSKLQNGMLFSLIDAMRGVRKNQFLGGIGKYEKEVSELTDADFDYNAHLYEVKKGNHFTGDCVEEKIIREQLVQERESMLYRARVYVAKVRQKREQFFGWYEAGIFTAYQYVDTVNVLVKRMKKALKTMRKRLENSAEMIRTRMKVEPSVWCLVS